MEGRVIGGEPLTSPREMAAHLRGSSDHVGLAAHPGRDSIPDWMKGCNVVVERADPAPSTALLWRPEPTDPKASLQSAHTWSLVAD